MLKNITLSQQVFEEIKEIYSGYSNEYRASTQPFYLPHTEKYLKDFQYDPENPIIRESLIEHVGSLPIIASSIFPHLEDNEIDLGHTLALLSVHDIGELITGDEITFTKKKDNNDNERKSALKILHPSLHSLYEEAENVQTKNAKFAKSIDKITPDILDVLTPPEITIIRYKHYTKWEAKDIVKIIKEHKHPYMTWNPFLRDFHLFLLDQLEQSLSPFYDKE